LETYVFLSVLAAALMHAGWNVIVKLNLDRLLALTLIQGLMGFFGIAMIWAFATPNAACWPFVAASGILHTGYNLFLARSYRTGDMGQVYPIARGTAPAMAVAGAYLWTGEALPPLSLAGLIVLILGIWFIAMRGGRLALRLDTHTLLFALATSAFIGAYTVVDGLGGRASGSVSAYTGYVYIFDALMLTASSALIRGPQAFRTMAPFWCGGLFGAVLSGGAYWIVIWAMSIAPIGAVAALRETSVLFAVALSTLFLGEPFTRWRVAGAVLIATGAALLKLG
jgi:drug/metabolite transporter (DMT)-like permease